MPKPFPRCTAGKDQTGRYEALANQFRSRFGGEPELFVSAPGRTEVVGNHTDHNKGRVLAAAVDLDTVAAVSPRSDKKVELYSDGYARPFRVDLTSLTPVPSEKETTLALIRGVAARLSQLGYKVGGFSACVDSARCSRAPAFPPRPPSRCMLVADFRRGV